MKDEASRVYDLLNELAEGAVFEYGVPFAMQDEPVVWKVLEVLDFPGGEKPDDYTKTLLLHLYYDSIYLGAQTVGLNSQTKSVTWAPGALNGGAT